MADRSVAASLSAYEPSWRERVGNATYDIARYLGLGSTANRMRNDVETAIDFVPLAGDAIGFNDAVRDISAGNYAAGGVGLGLAALGGIPIAGDVASGVAKKAIQPDIREMLSLARNRIENRGVEAARIVEDGKSVRMKSKDGRYVLVGRNTIEGEKPFRVTYFDEMGMPNGHVESDSLYDASIRAMEDGYLP